MRISASVAVSLLLALLVFPQAQAQTVDSVPTLQPTFTRVYVAEQGGIAFPSPSPDGRWIVFNKSEGDGQVSLWLVPMEGGEAIRLTEGHWDVQPVWFPSGNRLAFRSDRPSRNGNGSSYIMTLSIDPETGQTTGPPRQVSVEECFSYLDVSPDGQWIAFTAWSEGKAILVVPAAGGTSRVVARAGPWRPQWGPDGENIYYTVDRPLGDGEALVRVSADGAKVDTAFTGPKSIMMFGSPERRWALREISSGSAQPSLWEVVTLDGIPVGRLELPAGMDAMSATPGGRGFVAARVDREAPLEILPIDGGSPTRLNETRGQDWVVGWTPDGEEVFFRTTLDGGEAFFLASTAGGPMREVEFPEEPLDEFGPILSADGQHVLFATRDAQNSAGSLRILDLGSHESTELSDHLLLLPRSGYGEIVGRGGTFQRDGDDFLYVGRRGSDFELRAAHPDGASRLLRTFRGRLPNLLAVHGDRIAYTQRSAGRDPSVGPGHRGPETVMLAQAGEEEAHPLLTLPDRYLESVTWSWDGTKLALSADRMDPESQSPKGMEMLLLEVGSSGDLLGQPTVLATPEGRVFWSPRWLPDDRSLLIPAGNAMVWRVSTNPGTGPVNITSDLDLQGSWVYVADFRLSPDGRFIAYARGISRGSSIWRVDLGDALNRSSR